VSQENGAALQDRSRGATTASTLARPSNATWRSEGRHLQRQAPFVIGSRRLSLPGNDLAILGRGRQLYQLRRIRCSEALSRRIIGSNPYSTATIRSKSSPQRPPRRATQARAGNLFVDSGQPTGKKKSTDELNILNQDRMPGSWTWIITRVTTISSRAAGQASARP
jgi:hypothetical protein